MPTVWKKFKVKINKFLEKLANENQKTFGSGGLDCCKLNRKDNVRK